MEALKKAQEENEKRQEELNQLMQESWENRHKDGAGDLMP